MTIGMTIDGMLQKIGKTQSWLASELGVSRSTVWRICSGKIKPGEKLVRQISEILFREDEHFKKNHFARAGDFDIIITISTLQKIMGDPNTSDDERRKIGIVVNLISAL